MAFKILEGGEGFPFNLSIAKRDELALEAAQYAFGPVLVNKLCDSYNRASLSYDALMDDFLEYDRKRAPRPLNDHVYKLVLASVLQDFNKCKKVIPLTTGAVTKVKDFPNTKSPGLPYKLLGFKTKREVIESKGFLDNNRKLWHSIGARKTRALPDVCLFARSQVSKGSEQKIRATWGYPIDVYMEEARFFYPILEYISSKDSPLPIAYGLEMALGGMNVINSKCRKYKNYVMTDWSKFDKTIPAWLIRDAFSILATMVNFNIVKDSEGKCWPVRGERSRRRWKAMIDYFVSTPIRTCKGERFLVTGGVPSGSCFTNIIDSVINMIVSRYIFYQTCGILPECEMYLGDDGLIMTNHHVINLEEMAAVALNKFSMIMNVKKSYFTQNRKNIHFLGYYNIDGYPFKPQDSLIVSFIYPERTRRTHLEAAAAALGQMWSGFDPYYAYHWHQVLCFIQQRYYFEAKDVESLLVEQQGRHKYLKLIGVNPAFVTWPKPSEGGYILQVLPKHDTKRKLKHRTWNYNALWGYALETFYDDTED